MPLTLDWDISSEDWGKHTQNVRRLPLLQHDSYGQAISTFYGHTIRHAAIRRDEALIGLCTIQESGILYDLLQAVMCDRGPVWLQDFSPEEHQENFDFFAQALNKKFPRRLGRRRRFIPEYAEAHDILDSKKWRKNGDGYDTIWIDLTHSEETLSANLKKNWRGSLKKFQKSNVIIEWDDSARTLPLFLKYYELDKKQRGYDGPSAQFLRTLGTICADKGDLLLGRALIDDTTVSSIMILRHALNATYQVGWTSDEGRNFCAHHGLLWQAMLRLKESGIKDFDLGGINSQSASGVEKFKAGMGGALVTLPGLYG